MTRFPISRHRLGSTAWPGAELVVVGQTAVFRGGNCATRLNQADTARVRERCAAAASDGHKVRAGYLAVTHCDTLPITPESAREIAIDLTARRDFAAGVVHQTPDGLTVPIMPRCDEMLWRPPVRQPGRVLLLRAALNWDVVAIDWELGDFGESGYCQLQDAEPVELADELVAACRGIGPASVDDSVFIRRAVALPHSADAIILRRGSSECLLSTKAAESLAAWLRAIGEGS